MKLEGFEDRRFILQKEFNAIAILNFAGWVGWLVDIGTGSVFKYSRKDYALELEPKAYNIKELQKDTFGRLIVPDNEMVVDRAHGEGYSAICGWRFLD